MCDDLALSDAAIASSFRQHERLYLGKQAMNKYKIQAQ